MKLPFLILHIVQSTATLVRTPACLAAIAALSFVATSENLCAQQNVFSRGEATTDLWWDTSQNPWFYQTWGSTENRPDIWPVGTRNFVFIGHNNNTTMRVNGAFFSLASLTIESTASSSRTFNAIDGGGISLTLGFTNASTGSQTFNVPIGIDGGTVNFRANNGSANTAFTGDFFLNANTANFGGSSGATSFMLSGTVSGTGGQIVKQDSNFLILSGNNTYTGATTINGGTVEVGANNALGTVAAGTTVASGATLDFQNVVYSTAEGVTLNGGAIATTTGTSTFAGAVTLGANSIYNVSGTQLTQSGAITDVGSTFGITKTGAGILVLGAANTFDGSILISGGTLSVSADNRLGNTSASAVADRLQFGGGTLAVTTGFTLNSNRGITLNTGGGTIEVASSQTLSYSGLITGANNLAKTGAGTLTLSGAGANTYAGLTTVSGGVLELNKTAGVNAIAGNVTVGNGATLLISQSNQVANTSAVTLSGGTIARGGNVSEVFGNLNLTTASFLDFGASSDAGTMRFGTYTPSSLLTVQNFMPGNKLQFGSTLTQEQLANTSLFSFSNGFTTSTEDGFFTITAIPEPSTYAAAAGLLALFLWPVRRRLIKDAKSILCLRPTGRDRIEAYRNA